MDGQKRSPGEDEIERFAKVVRDARARVRMEQPTIMGELRAITDALRPAVLATKTYINEKFRRP